MSCQTILYDAYTGITPLEKNLLVRFLCEHAGNATCAKVEEAIDYALKRKPSFGGYILAIKELHRIVAALVVNRTGMEGYSPNNLCVYLGIDKQRHDQEVILQALMQKAISTANGDLAMHVEPDSPVLNVCQQLGFRAQYLELRLG